MKSSTLAYILTFMLFLNILIVCNLFSKTIYKDEVQTSVDNSVELAMSLLAEDASDRLDKLNLNSNSNLQLDNDTLNGLQKDFINILSQNLNGKITNLYVNFYAADEDAKLLSVEVLADFKYLDGHIGTVSTYKTMLIDKKII